ncbi:MAG: hypothetical protein ACRC0Y_04000 [Fusobacteriaceae bacterium]
MRIRKLKLSDEEFKEYLLDKYVDEQGQKVSVRQLWKEEDFMEYTGMFKINSYTGRRERVSEGTISYYNRILCLTEKELFDFHQQITKRILATVTFDEWSRKNNRGYTRQELINQDTVKRRMIKYFGLNENYVHYSHDKVRELCARLVGREEIALFYESLKEGE